MIDRDYYDAHNPEVFQVVKGQRSEVTISQPVGQRDAHELWALAQLAPGEGVEDGVKRIERALAASPAQAVDLGQFREAVEHWRRDLASDYKNGHMDDGGSAMAEADRLLALIDSNGSS